MAVSLEIQSLSAAYPGGIRALDNISLQVNAGMFGLLGPNGAGKSTLMRILATLQSANSGTVRFDGTDVLRQKDSVRQHLGYLPQEFGFYPRSRALELLTYFAVLKQVPDPAGAAAAMLERVNLESARNRRLGEFSGGMKQRFGIAQALLGSPRLLIVDEPTAGLDPAERTRFLNLLSEMSNEMVVLLSTHIVEDVNQLCANIAIIAEGRIRYQGTPDELIRQLEGKVWTRTMSSGAVGEVSRMHTVLLSRLRAGRAVAFIYAGARPDMSFEPAEPDLELAYFHVLQNSAL